MAFEILAGSYLHPYLGEKELRVVEGCPVGSVKFKAGALMYGAPRVMWPEGVRESYPEALVAVVEKLLSRHNDRAGLKEVRKL
jgi:hypothetical protein